METLKSIVFSGPFLFIGGILFILLHGYIMVNYNNAYWGNVDSDGNYKPNDKLTEIEKLPDKK